MPRRDLELPTVNSDSPLGMMRGVLTLNTKQYVESRISVLNDSPEFLYIIRIFLILHYKQCEKLQLLKMREAPPHDK
jgi:hypothetical protein